MIISCRVYLEKGRQAGKRREAPPRRGFWGWEAERDGKYDTPRLA